MTISNGVNVLKKILLWLFPPRPNLHLNPHVSRAYSDKTTRQFFNDAERGNIQGLAPHAPLFDRDFDTEPLDDWWFMKPDETVAEWEERISHCRVCKMNPSHPGREGYCVDCSH